MNRSLLFLLVLSMNFSLHSQTKETQYHFQIRAGANFPVGNFFNENENISIGTAMSTLFYYTPRNTDLSFLFEAGFFFNKFKKEYIESVEKHYRLISGSAYSIVNLSEYFNIPMIVGMIYEFNISNPVSLFVEGAIGVDILKITKSESIIGIWYQRDTYSPSLSFTYKGGFGFIVKDHYIIACDYHWLGKHNVNIESLRDGKIYSRELNGLKGNLLALTVGYKF